jgi:hypothetical protein
MKLKRYKQFVSSVNEEREAPKYDSIDDFRSEMDDFNMADDMSGMDMEADKADFRAKRRVFDEGEEGDLTDEPPVKTDRFCGSEEGFDEPGFEMTGDVDDEEIEKFDDLKGDLDLPDYEEEENKLHDLAKMLGTEVRDNQVNFGEHTVNYYSETGNLHIGSKEFETAEDAADFLQGGQARVLRDTNESKSYRFRNRKK